MNELIVDNKKPKSHINNNNSTNKYILYMIVQWNYSEMWLTQREAEKKVCWKVRWNIHFRIFWTSQEDASGCHCSSSLDRSFSITETEIAKERKRGREVRVLLLLLRIPIPVPPLVLVLLRHQPPSATLSLLRLSAAEITFLFFIFLSL